MKVEGRGEVGANGGKMSEEAGEVGLKTRRGLLTKRRWSVFTD